MKKKLSWWKKLLYRFSFHTDVEKALDTMLHRGIDIGMRHAAGSCPQCSTPLQGVSQGMYACPLCKPQLTSDVERVTDPALSIHPVSPIRQRGFRRTVTTDTLHVAVPPRGEHRG